MSEPSSARAALIDAIRLQRITLARRRLLEWLYPDEDTVSPWGQAFHARRKWPRHLEFFRLGAVHRDRGAMCANRIGKTFGMGGYEVAVHLTGRYPPWWEGRRFDRPVDVLAAGITTDATRDTVQTVLIGPHDQPEAWGTGLIPWADLKRDKNDAVVCGRRANAPGAIDTISVQHRSGGWSKLQFRSTDQGREKFQGTARDIVWFDEEPPIDVYGEGQMRTVTTNGLLICTFTPLLGLSEVALTYAPHMRPVAEAA